MPVQAVLFDLGETILNYGAVDIDTCFDAGARLTYDYLAGHTGQTGSAGRLGDFKAYRRREKFSIKLRYAWAGLTLREFDCLALLASHTRRMGFDLGRAELEELAWLWYRPLGATATIEPDLHQSLAALKDKMQLKLAIVSNTFLPAAVLDRQLAGFELLDFFQLRCYSSSVVYRKPHRRIYEGVLDRLGVSADAAVMVGDTPRADVWGPARLGITPVFKRTPANASRTLAEHIPVIETISELPALIGGMNTL